MIVSRELLTISFWWYPESNWEWRYLGQGRRALDLGRFSIRFEVWTTVKQFAKGDRK